MKIMFLSPVSTFKGGAEQSITLLIEELIKVEKIYFFTNKSGSLNIYLKNIGAIEYLDSNLNFNSIKREDSLYKNTIKFFELYKNIDNIVHFLKKNEIDIIHSNGLKTHILSVLIKLKYKKIKVIWHIRDIFIEKKYKIVFSFLSYFTDKIILVSKACEINFYFFKSKLTVVRNPLKNIILSKKLTINNSFKKIGIIGRISPYKGQLDAVKILKKLYDLGHKDVSLRIIGTYENKDKKYFDEIVNYIKEHKLNKYVFFDGFISDIYDIYKTIDLVLVTSPLPDPSPRVVYESFLFKKIVFAYDSGGIKETFKVNKEKYLARMSDFESLSYKVDFMLKNKKSYIEDIEINYQYILVEYDKKTHANNIINIYRSILK